MSNTGFKIPGHWWGKLIGGIIGLMRGGLVGAIFGVFLGHMVDRFLVGLGGASRTRDAFFGAMFSTLGHINKADGRVTKVEIEAAEELMRRESIPLFSLESSRPAREFDAIGFTLVDEMVATNMLAVIDLAGIALRSTERTEDDPIIMAGGPAVFNPEPLAPFVDLFFIGDAEEGLPQMLEVLQESRNLARIDKLRAIVKQVDSVYVPMFYDDQARPIESLAPDKIKSRLVPELKPEYYPSHPILPLVLEVQWRSTPER